MKFKQWLIQEEISTTLPADKLMAFLNYVKQTNPNTPLKNPLEKQTNVDRKTQYAELERRKKEILDYYQTLPDEEKQKFQNFEQQQLQNRILQGKKESKRRYLDDHPHMTEEDYDKLYGQGTPATPQLRYQAKLYQRNKWLEKIDREKWNNLTIVHWFGGDENKKYIQAANILTGKIPPHTELSATYYPKDFNMSNVGKNRWGDFAVQLQGEVVSGHSGDAASDDRWHPDGRQANLGDFGTPEAPVEKFGGKAYTLKPAFDTETGWNELIIRNWKIVAFLMYKNNKNGIQKTPNEIKEDQKIIELAKSKGIPVKIID